MFKLSKWIRGAGLSVLIVCTILAMALPASASQIAGKTNGRPESPQGVGTAPTLGLAAGYAVLGASAITNTGNSVINGNLGLSPGTSVTGFPPGIVNGTQHVTDTAAANAQSALVTAYNALTSQSAGSVDLTGQDLGGLTLTPGVYRFSSSAGLTGTLTLNA
ncbi:MAG TPA: ice-binding family protein, partial [Dehalococcoidales bacterium]|nr:ice-binding family protein [Dehalococcoidales bacterium]